MITIYINQAIEEALPKGKMITRECWEEEGFNIYVIPTNTSASLIFYNPNADEVKHRLGPRWQPETTDLVAKDWLVKT